ncbi:MAG: hypothetical protein ACJ76H_08970 [Bacteriovoracaceae bacterium]
MLQPRQPVPAQPELVAKILWSALTGSMFLYGIILFVLGKVSAVFIPYAMRPLDYMAVFANIVVFYVLFIHHKKVSSQTNPQKKNTLNIICWAMNEWIVICGFIAVFSADNGNAFFYVTNLAVGLVGNLLTFPKK